MPGPDPASISSEIGEPGAVAAVSELMDAGSSPA
jgi:hypothetical protein